MPVPIWYHKRPHFAMILLWTVDPSETRESFERDVQQDLQAKSMNS